MGRSKSKWDFLKDISGENLARLTWALQNEVDRMRESGHIASFEHEYATRDIGFVAAGKLAPSVLTSLAGQPYNIDFWKDWFLDKAGLKGAVDPLVYRVAMKGKFARLSSMYPPASLYRILRRAGIDGVFVKGGMAAVPQMAVWNPRAIKKITLDAAKG
jgi:hypothetical protein